MRFFSRRRPDQDLSADDGDDIGAEHDEDRRWLPRLRSPPRVPLGRRSVGPCRSRLGLLGSCRRLSSQVESRASAHQRAGTPKTHCWRPIRKPRPSRRTRRLSARVQRATRPTRWRGTSSPACRGSAARSKRPADHRRCPGLGFGRSAARGRCRRDHFARTALSRRPRRRRPASQPGTAAEQAGDEATRLNAQAGAIADPRYVSLMSDARSQLQGQIADLTSVLENTALAARLMPSMMGADGPRTYFMGFQTNAEARGTGGLLGGFGILRFDNGVPTVDTLAPNTDLTDAIGPDRPGTEYDQQYGSRIHSPTSATAT